MIFLRSLISFFLIVGVFGCARLETQKPITVVLGEKPLPEVSTCSESPEVFLKLAKKGRKAATILLFSSRIGLQPVSAEGMSELRGMVKKEQWKEMMDNMRGRADSPVSFRNYLTAASKLGLVNKVYWVIPSRELEYSDAERRIQVMLSSEVYGFSRDEIGGMRFGQGCVSGMLSGVKTHICSVETLPIVEGPVTLDIDAGFFPLYAEGRGMNVLAGIKEFFEQCYKRRVEVEQAFVRKTQREETLGPLHLYVPDVVLGVLDDPSAIHKAPPDLWVTWNAAATLLAEEQFRDATALLREAEKRYPRQTVLKMFDGVSDALGSDAGRGLATLSDLCGQEPETCYSLMYAGRGLMKKKEEKDAEKFFSEAMKRFDQRHDQEMVQKVWALIKGT